MGDALMSFTSHVKGKNGKIDIHTDRIEWGQFGITGKVKNTEVIPVRSITSVTVKKDGLVWRSVQVITSGNTIDFRLDKVKADQVRDLLTDLMIGKHPSQLQPMAPPAAPQAPPIGGTSVADELSKLAALREAGHLTDEEFAAQKAKVLGG